MLRITPFLLLVLVAFPMSSFAEPAELTAARMAYETKLSVPKGKLEAALVARRKQYAGVVKRWRSELRTIIKHT